MSMKTRLQVGIKQEEEDYNQLGDEIDNEPIQDFPGSDVRAFTI